jgi:F-type H+-transporting ATPase subunit a
MSSLHVSIVAEKITEIGGMPITNTLITSTIVVASLSIGSFIFYKNIKKIPGRIQSALEMIVGGILDFMTTVAGDRKTSERFFPIIATIFIFVLCSNWAGILPGVGSILIKETGEHGEKMVPLFRSTFSDLNMTLAIALIAVSLSHFFGVITIGVKEHFGKFFNFSNPVFTFAGLLEIVSEVAKVVSFSFRLFGNIFAGEVLLTIIAFLVPYIAPIPFLGMELFVGLIQALIFSTLAMVGFASFTKAHDHH